MTPKTPANAPPSSASDRWSYNSTVLLLAYISFRSDQFGGDDEGLLEDAARVLSKEFDQKYTSKRVKDRLKRLWNTCGHDDDKSIFELFEYGVHWRTLPYLETYEHTKISYFDVKKRTDFLKR